MLSRRRFLEVVGAGGAAAAAAGCGEEYDFTPDVGRFDVGVPDEYAIGDLQYKDTGPILVCRDDAGMYVMSAICTHQACFLGDDAEEVDGSADPPIECKCHKSQYDANGVDLAGPSTKPLQHYALTLEDGRLIADTGVRVDRDARLTV